jgi:hypothetical protein
LFFVIQHSDQQHKKSITMREAMVKPSYSSLALEDRAVLYGQIYGSQVSGVTKTPEDFCFTSLKMP